VTVVGPVADMVDELAAADVVIVPVRFGSGTRLKILEAFAHRVPVVSTTLAAEGLDAVDGEHLLVADDAEGLARACARLLDPSGPRGRLVEAAERLYLDRYRQEVVGPRVAGVADAVARGVPVSP
jgi:glycosyltransferase involved in cell wall biosynthesis